MGRQRNLPFPPDPHTPCDLLSHKFRLKNLRNYRRVSLCCHSDSKLKETGKKNENKTEVNNIPNSVWLIIPFVFEDPFVLV